MSQDLTEEKLWVEKYRPRSIKDVILPDDLKRTFEEFVTKGDIPNLVLQSSSGGTGKTTVSRAICNDLHYDVLFINASLEANIDTLRSKMTSFVTSVSFTGNRKCIILDESDGLNQLVQNALRAFIEKFSKNCRFIFTCNYVNKLLPQLLSRCTVIDFNFKKEQRKEVLQNVLKRLFFILHSENIEYDEKAVFKLLMAHEPDIRRCINELQRYSVVGKIDEGILVSADHDNYSKVAQFVAHKDFKSMREWVGTNPDVPPEKLFKYFFENGNKFIEAMSIPQMVITTAEYQYKSAFAVDQQINTTAYLTELMLKCKFIGGQ